MAREVLDVASAADEDRAREVGALRAATREPASPEPPFGEECDRAERDRDEHEPSRWFDVREQEADGQDACQDDARTADALVLRGADRGLVRVARSERLEQDEPDDEESETDERKRHFHRRCSRVDEEGHRGGGRDGGTYDEGVADGEAALVSPAPDAGGLNGVSGAGAREFAVEPPDSRAERTVAVQGRADAAHRCLAGVGVDWGCPPARARRIGSTVLTGPPRSRVLGRVSVRV